MITIDRFEVSHDLRTLHLKVTSTTFIDTVLIYVGNDFIVGDYYTVPTTGTELTVEVDINYLDLGATLLTNIYIVQIEDVVDEILEAGTWSREPVTHCLADAILNYPEPCANCLGLTAINIVYMNAEAVTMLLANNDLIKALAAFDTILLYCVDLLATSVPADPECPDGIGCWILEYNFVVE